MTNERLIKCPCCEHESTYDEWYAISNDDFAWCPKCENACTYDEFKEGDFEEKTTIPLGNYHASLFEYHKSNSDEFVMVETFFDTDTNDISYQVIVNGMVSEAFETLDPAVKYYAKEVAEMRVRS